jgi:hypothetical protein
MRSMALEKFAFVTAYMARKLAEAEVLTLEVTESKWAVQEFRCTVPPPHRRWFAISEDRVNWRQPLEQHYDLPNPTATMLPFRKVCGYLIHHFAFETRLRAGNHVQILFNSDWSKDRLYSIVLTDSCNWLPRSHSTTWRGWTCAATKGASSSGVVSRRRASSPGQGMNAGPWDKARDKPCRTQRSRAVVSGSSLALWCGIRLGSAVGGRTAPCAPAERERKAQKFDRFVLKSRAGRDPLCSAPSVARARFSRSCCRRRPLSRRLPAGRSGRRAHLRRAETLRTTTPRVPRCSCSNALALRRTASSCVGIASGHEPGHIGDTLPVRKPGFGSTPRGADRNRTGVNGFAGRCVATPPRRRGGV